MERDELYDYPSDHTGRKHYVSVRGHKWSIPSFKTYKGADDHYHLSPEYGGPEPEYGTRSAYYVPDKAEYLSPMSGEVISGRFAHRDHMKRHDVVEAGDMPIGYLDGKERGAPMPRVAEDIVRVLKQEGYMG